MAASVIPFTSRASGARRRTDGVVTTLDGGMARLVEVVQELSFAWKLDAVQAIVCRAARELTGCDGATLIFREGHVCHFADENALAPLWKGKRVPEGECLAGAVMRSRTTAVIPDIDGDPRTAQSFYRSTFVKSLALAPIRTADPIGAIGACWASYHEASSLEVLLLQALADSASIAIEKVATRSDLDRVISRTQALISANETLQRLALIDELTGIYNRRGFYHAARRAAEARTGGLVLFIDIDGLKKVNDRLGHAAGDAVIVSVAAALRRCFRQHDVIGRLGGDEFCVIVRDPAMDQAALRGILVRRLNEINQAAKATYRAAISIGIVAATAADLQDIDGLIARADTLMYADKNAKRETANDQAPIAAG